MLKYITFLLLLPIFILGQEQVSDISSYGVYYSTDISHKVGFANLGGTHYMLEEKDSLIISKYENGAFHHQYTIQNFNNKERSYTTLAPNRSLFEIRDGLYYRIFRDGFQIIDIEKGEVNYEFDFATEGFGLVSAQELYQNRYYFKVNLIGENRDYVLDITTNEVSLTEIPSREYRIQVGDNIAGLDADNVYVYNAHTKKDSLIYHSPIGNKSLSYSEHDSTFTVLENDGSLWKIDNNLNLVGVDCKIPNIEDLKSLKVNGNKIIAIYNYVDEYEFQDSVAIIDIGTCQNDLSIITEALPISSNFTHFVVKESIDVDYSIFGYIGYNSFDGFNEGLYYIIDHKKNIATPITKISMIQSYTPFVFDGAIYLTGISSSFWSWNEYIVKYDLATSTVTKHDPNPDILTRNISLGFFEDNNLICAANTILEDPKLWGLSSEEEFSEIQPLDFSFDRGVDYVSNVIPMNDRIYFSTNSGIHSVRDDSRTELPFTNYSHPVAQFQDLEVAIHGDKLAIVRYNDETPTFSILNTATGAVDTVIDNETKAKRGKSVGPFIFYSQGNSEDTLHYFDLKTKTIHTFDELPYVIDSWFVEGENKAFYNQNASFADKVAYLIDYTTNEFKEIDIEFEYYDNVIPGYDDSFYIIDRKISSENSRIRLLTKNGNVTTIYEGKGRFYGSATSYYKEHPATVINLFHGDDTAIFIVNDLDNTEVKEIPYDYSFSNRNALVKNRDGKSILKTSDSEGVDYWFYEAFGPIKEIETVTNKTLAFSDLSDSLAVLVFYDQENSTTSIVKYNYKNDLKSNFEEVSNACGRTDGLRGIALSDEEYLIATECDDIGNELWILNVAEGSFNLLVDFYPGKLSSSPQYFMKFEDWIYFVLRKEDDSKQWFRLNANFPSSIIEVSENDFEVLNVYPSPAKQSIHIDQNLKEFSVYSIRGQLIFQEYGYEMNQPIDIDFLENGTYMIVAKTENNEVVSNKFIKVR